MRWSIHRQTLCSTSGVTLIVRCGGSLRKVLRYSGGGSIDLPGYIVARRMEESSCVLKGLRFAEIARHTEVRKQPRGRHSNEDGVIADEGIECACPDLNSRFSTEPIHSPRHAFGVQDGTGTK